MCSNVAYDSGFAFFSDTDELQRSMNNIFMITDSLIHIFMMGSLLPSCSKLFISGRSQSWTSVTFLALLRILHEMHFKVWRKGKSERNLWSQNQGCLLEKFTIEQRYRFGRYCTILGGWDWSIGPAPLHNCARSPQRWTKDARTDAILKKVDEALRTAS